MKVLVLLSYDAANKGIVNIIKELLSRHHQIIAYGSSIEKHNIWMISELGISVKHVSQLNKRVIKECDFIFCANDTLSNVMTADKYIFSFNMASAFGTAMPDCGDFMFEQSSVRYNYVEQKCSRMIVGNPKFDNTNIKLTKKENVILFIDSGHYPFGLEGKRCLAKLLYRIAERFPSYKVVVKPRFLKGEEEVTHLNKVHLYDVLRDVCNYSIPKNIVLLEEHLPMDVLIENANTVICAYTSAFIDVLAEKRGLIILKNLPNKDSVDLNNDFFWKKTLEELEKTGCVVDYRNVLDYLPDGLNCDDSYRNESVELSLYGKASHICVDVMEYVNDNFLKNGVFPKISEYDCIRFIEGMKPDESVTLNLLKRNRVENYLKYRATRYLDAFEHDISLKLYIENIHNHSEKILKSNFSACSLRDELLIPLFHIVYENKKLLIGNGIKESYLLEAIYHCDRESLFHITERDFICTRSVYYFRGQVKYERRMYEEASKDIEVYIEMTQNVDYEEFLTDRLSFLNSAKERLAKISPSSDTRVLIYGAGKESKKILDWYKQKCKVIAYIDKNESINQKDNLNVVRPEAIKNIAYDVIVISLIDWNISTDIKKALIELGVESEKIIQLPYI